MNATTKGVEEAVKDQRGRTSKRGTLTREEVTKRAEAIFSEELDGLNNWDRRRILQQVERISRMRRA